MKYTPGPWNREMNYIFDEHNRGIATCYNMSGSGEANARLIAAAPDLLEALKILHPRWEVWITPTEEMAHFIENAIDKAEGKETP